MKKIIKNKFYDTGNFEITVEKDFIKIINIDNLSKIKNIEIYGKVDNIKKAMIISENYIEKIENRNNEYFKKKIKSEGGRFNRHPYKRWKTGPSLC